MVGIRLSLVLVTCSVLAACQSNVSTVGNTGPNATQAVAVATPETLAGDFSATYGIEPGSYTWFLHKGRCAHLTIGARNSYRDGPCGRAPDFIARNVKVKNKDGKIKISIDFATMTVSEIGEYGFRGVFELSGERSDAFFLRDVPSLDTLTVNSPNENVPQEYSAFLGYWRGKWNNYEDSEVVIQDVLPDGSARGAYAWDDHTGGNYSAGRTRIRGKIAPGSTGGWHIFTSEPMSNGTVLILKLTMRDRNTILGVNIRENGGSSYATYKKS